MKPIMAAHKVLNRFGIHEVGPVPVEPIAFGLDLIVDSKPIDGAEGRLVRRSEKGIAVVDSDIRSIGKRRFVIAHELGHFLLHREPGGLDLCDEDALVDWHGNRPQEEEANVFAAELLMPKDQFRDEAGWREMGADTIDALKGTFQVSFTSAAIRYVELDVTPSAVVFSQNGEIRWFRASDSFPYSWIPVGQEVREVTGAGRYFWDGEVSDEPEPTACEAWFEDEGTTVEGNCLEQCVAMPNYNAMLSLIWQP
jgi:hypothetical protein